MSTATKWAKPTEYYEHPQETWDKAECAKRARFNPPNGYGDKNPWPGLIADSSSPYPMYGQTVRYNGGVHREGKFWVGETRPLPVIHEDYEFKRRCSWGTYIQLKETMSESEDICTVTRNGRHWLIVTSDDTLVVSRHSLDTASEDPLTGAELLVNVLCEEIERRDKVRRANE